MVIHVSNITFGESMRLALTITTRKIFIKLRQKIYSVYIFFSNWQNTFGLNCPTKMSLLWRVRLERDPFCNLERIRLVQNAYIRRQVNSHNERNTHRSQLEFVQIMISINHMHSHFSRHPFGILINVSTDDIAHGPLTRYVKLQLRMRRECRERFPPPPISKETAS